MDGNFYDQNDKVLIAVDCIIFGFDQYKEELQLLLVKRDFEPEKGKWSLMGGFMHQRETLREAAARVLCTLTGLSRVYMEQLRAFSKVDRDPEERTVSVAFYALINIKDHDRELTKQHSAKWFNISSMPKLIFDHDLMIQTAIQRLRYRTSIQPIGFELLPKKFTMRQLQTLYEKILDQQLDKRNFTKKINKLDILQKLAEKDKSSSRKGSFLYTFDQNKYLNQQKHGLNFKV